MPDKIAYRFVGDRDPDGVPLEYLGGIPAINLTEADVDALSVEQRKLVRSSPLYKAAESRPARSGKPTADAGPDAGTASPSPPAEPTGDAAPE